MAGNVMNFGEVFHTHPLKDAAGTFLRFAEDHNIRLSETRTRLGRQRLQSVTSIGFASRPLRDMS